MLWEKIKVALNWLLTNIKNHPYLTVALVILLAAGAYFLLPFISGSALSIGITTLICAIAGPALGGLLGWVGENTGLLDATPAPVPPVDLVVAEVQPPVFAIDEEKASPQEIYDTLSGLSCFSSSHN